MRHTSPQDLNAIRARAQAQFAPAAQAYVTSTIHAQGTDLARIVALAAPRGHELALDIATGGGHAALALAPRVAQMVASDLTVPMLHAARTHHAAQGLSNISYLRAAAELLPVAPSSFDLVLCRVAAHHFADVRAFVREAARALKPGGTLIVADHIGLEDPEQDAFMDRFERWRDPSHVRAYSFAEWTEFCKAAGLDVTHAEEDRKEPYEFDSWTTRLRMPAHERNALERWLLEAPAHLRERFAVTEREGRVVSLRGTFGIVVARK